MSKLEKMLKIKELNVSQSESILLSLILTVFALIQSSNLPLIKDAVDGNFSWKKSYWIDVGKIASYVISVGYTHWVRYKYNSKIDDDIKVVEGKDTGGDEWADNLDEFSVSEINPNPNTNTNINPIL